MTDDYRKRRGPLACAECRRLKLKCDRKVPCSSCSKRGCGAVCPNGTLAAGPGNRFVLADTRHLHEQIETMSKKISELEDVLAGLHTGDEQHPLLTEEHMLVKALPSTEKANDASNRPLASLLGTLAIGDEPRFYGPNAASDFLLQIPTNNGGEAVADGDEKWNVSSSAASTLAPDLLALARTFPLANLADLREEVWPRLESLLLPEHVARGLVESYYTYAGWMFEVVPRAELVAGVFDKMYKSGSVPNLSDVTPHDLGLLSILMAVGAMVQISSPSGMYPTQAADLYQIARISLSLDSVLDHPTVQAVRAVHLMAWFLHMSDHPGGVTISYNLLGLNAQLCHSLGLHRDDTPWNLDPGEKQRRRTALWDVVAFDCWVSEALGRPPSFSVLHLDAKMPEEEDAEGQSFRQWMHHFTNACVLKVLDQAFGVARLTHATVLRLDRVVREEAQVKGDALRVVNVGKPEELFLANPAAAAPGVEMGMEAEDVRVRRAMQRTTVFVLTQKCLLYLHRSFFAQALADSPTDPLKSKHAQSVLAAFRAAFYITASVRACHAALPALSVRYWFLWSEAFSACVILGSVVAKSPGSGLAPAAWVELDRMYELFDTLAGSSESQCIRRLLPKLRRLRNSAQASYATFTGKDDVPAVDVEEMMDEMEMKYGTGWTRLVDTSPAAPSPPAPAPEQQRPQQQPQGGTWRQPQPITPVPVVPVPQHQQQYPQLQQQQQQYAPMGSYPAAGPSHMSIPGPSSSSSFQQRQTHNSTLTPPMFTDLNMGQFDLLPQYPQHQQPEPAFPDLDYVPPPPLPLLPQTMFDDGSNVLLSGTSAWDLPQSQSHQQQQQQYGVRGTGGQGEYDASGIDLNAAWNEFVGSMGVGGPPPPQDVEYNVNANQFAHPPPQQQQQHGGQMYPTQYGYAG